MFKQMDSKIEKTISKLPCASVSKRVMVENLYLHENEPFQGAHFHTISFPPRLVLTQIQRKIRKWPILALRSSHIFKAYVIISPLKIWFRFYFSSYLWINAEFHKSSGAGLVYCPNIVHGRFSSGINSHFENPYIAPEIEIVLWCF